MSENWQVVMCSPTMFGEKQPERPYIKHHDMVDLKFHLVTTYKSMEPPTCLCGDEIPADILRLFNFKATGYTDIQKLPVPENGGLII